MPVLSVWSAAREALVNVMMSFLCVTLDFEFANASTVVFGLNAAARPNSELNLRNLRRERLSDSMIVPSACDLDSLTSVVIVSTPSTDHSGCVTGENKIAILD